VSILAAVIAPVSGFVRSHLTFTCMAMSATLVAIYSGTAIRLIGHAVGRLPFLGRLTVFVLWCAFGYGLVTVTVGSLTARALARLDNVWLAPAVVGLFLALGLAAEREGHL
jgi:hypothetical protein